MSETLHLDWIDYAERLLGSGAIDWGNPSAVSELISKAQALLPSDLVILPVARMLSALASPTALAAKPRGAQPMRALLADEAIRARLLETVAMLSVPALVLDFPAPGELAVLASDLAGLPAPEIDEDLVDDAAVYLADFLRIFATSPIKGIVLAESGDRAALRALCTPVEKVAASYGWHYAVGDLWPGIRTVKIPADGEPETVLATVRALGG